MQAWLGSSVISATVSVLILSIIDVTGGRMRESSYDRAYDAAARASLDSRRPWAETLICIYVSTRRTVSAATHTLPHAVRLKRPRGARATISVPTTITVDVRPPRLPAASLRRPAGAVVGVIAGISRDRIWDIKRLDLVISRGRQKGDARIAACLWGTRGAAGRRAGCGYWADPRGGSPAPPHRSRTAGGAGG